MDFGQLVVSGSDKNAANRGDLVVKNKIPVGMFQRKRMIPLLVRPIASNVHGARCRLWEGIVGKSSP